MPHPPRHRRPATLATALAVVVIVGVVTGCGPGGSQDAAPTATSSPATSSPAAGTPSPAPAVPAASALPVGSADLAEQPTADVVVRPASLRIPAQGIELPVDDVGVQADGQMEIPPLAERGGWYRYGAAPGADAGTAVIAAHVDSIASAGLGPFARLTNVVAGDVVEVRLQDGTGRDYAVVSVERIAKADVRWPEVFTRDGPHRLVLITCGGVFQRAAGRYTDNVVLTASPVGGT